VIPDLPVSSGSWQINESSIDGGNSIKMKRVPLLADRLHILFYLFLPLQKPPGFSSL
jgi:hypothetical protein